MSRKDYLRLVENDKQSLDVPPGWVVSRAWYGDSATDEPWSTEVGADVTNKVKELLAASKPVRATKADLSVDPAPGKKKALMVVIVYQAPPMEECCACLREFLNRPLGGFVLMAVWVAGLEAISLGFAFCHHTMLSGCTFPAGVPAKVGIVNWLWVQSGFAALNVLFAPYLQVILWRILVRLAKEPDNPNDISAVQARSASNPLLASKEDVAKSFKELMTKHPSVWVYIAFLWLSLAWSILGCVWIGNGGADCNPYNYSLYTAWLGLSYFTFIACYVAMWFFNISNMHFRDVLTVHFGSEAVDSNQGTDPSGAELLQEERVQSQTHSKRSHFFFGGSGSKSAVFDDTPSTDACLAEEGGSKLSRWFSSHHSTNHAPPPPPKKMGPCSMMIKLAACFCLDMLGNATYMVPAVGEVGDAVFAPASGVMIKMLYNSNSIAIIGALEELLPYTDILPTASIAWFLEAMWPDSCLSYMIGLRRVN